MRQRAPVFHLPPRDASASWQRLSVAGGPPRNFERKCTNMPSDLAGRRGGAASCRPGRNTDLRRTLLGVLTPKPHTALAMYNYNRSIRLRRPVPRCIASCKLGSAGRRSEPVRGRQQGSFRSPVWSKLRCAPEPPFAAMMVGVEIVIEIGIGNRKTLGRVPGPRERHELMAAPYLGQGWAGSSRE
jgi:hypothetical protein